MNACLARTEQTNDLDKAEAMKATKTKLVPLRLFRECRIVHGDANANDKISECKISKQDYIRHQRSSDARGATRC